MFIPRFFPAITSLLGCSRKAAENINRESGAGRGSAHPQAARIYPLEERA
jgi:hypothetical protein